MDNVQGKLLGHHLAEFHWRVYQYLLPFRSQTMLYFPGPLRSSLIRVETTMLPLIFDNVSVVEGPHSLRVWSIN